MGYPKRRIDLCFTLSIDELATVASDGNHIPGVFAQRWWCLCDCEGGEKKTPTIASNQCACDLDSLHFAFFPFFCMSWAYG